MRIQIKHQEPVVTKVTEVELPYYFVTNEYEYSKKCFAVTEDFTMFTMYISETYQSMSMQPGSIEQIERMLDEAFNKYKNGKEITEAEFRLLIEEFNQNVPLNKTTPIK
jgi:hypothetical protein